MLFWLFIQEKREDNNDGWETVGRKPPRRQHKVGIFAQIYRAHFSMAWILVIVHTLDILLFISYVHLINFEEIVCGGCNC